MKNYLRLTLLSMLAIFFGGIAQAEEDVTATWDFQNLVPATMADVNIQGTDASGVIASNVEGIQLNVLAAVAGTNIKLKYNAGGHAQFNQNTMIQVPVKNAGDEVTVVSYPGQSNYTVGGEDATGQDTFTHQAKASEASAGHVAIIATSTAYLYSIQVVHKAPKAAITLDNEAASATFAFNLGTEGQKAAFSNADYFLSSKVSYGSGLTLKDKNTLTDAETSTSVDMTRFEPKAKETAAAESNAIRFLITPKPGFTFTPTKVSLKTTRFGTDGGKLDIAWQNTDKTTVSLATNVAPNRNNKNPNVSKLEYDLTSATAGEGQCGLLINLYSLDAGKQVGFCDVVIEGTLTGTEKEMPVLASFKINGTEYAVEDVFGDDFEATFKLSKSVAMVSATNPLTDITAASGEIGTVTYEGTETACKVTIPMTAGEVQQDYVLNVIQKPDYTLSYIGVDGTVLDTEIREEDQTIGAFKVDIATVAATKDGFKARGWFKQNYQGEKFTTADAITADTKLYALQTEIEGPSDSRKYTFDLADKFFYAEDHEAFNVVGSGHYHNNHGWVFGNGDQIELLVGKKANINFTLCQYSAAGATIEGGDKTIDAVVASDGGSGTLVYEGEEGTLTLTIHSTGAVYIHNITIFNTTTTNYDKVGDWIVVKQGDASSFLDAIEVAKGIEGAKVFVPNGTYDLGEAVLTSVGGTNVSLIGESTEGVIIKNTPPVSKEGLMSAATIVNGGTNLYMQDLTLQNDLDYYAAGSAGRANAFHDTGNHTICKNVRLLSYQDTYLSPTDKQLYWEDSEIHGTVDYLCGGSDVYFNRVKLVNESRKKNEKSGEATINAHQPRTAEQFGYVFNECTIENKAATFNFGRAWGGASGATARPMATYLNTTLNQPSELIATRFILKGMNSQAGVFHEFNSKDATGTVVSPTSLTETFTNNAGADELTYDIILSAEEAANYTLDKVFPDWQPNVIAQQLEAPAATFANGSVTWTPANDGAIAYLIEKNGDFVAITTDSQIAVEGVDASSDELTIRAANARGGFGPAKHVEGTAKSISKVARNMQNSNIYYNLAGQRVAQPGRGLYIVGGKKVVIK